MALGENQLPQWWEQRSDEQRAALKLAAAKSSLDSATTRLLLDTNCPVAPVGSKWESNPEWSWSWPEHVRQFVKDQ